MVNLSGLPIRLDPSPCCPNIHQPEECHHQPNVFEDHNKHEMVDTLSVQLHQIEQK